MSYPGWTHGGDSSSYFLFYSMPERYLQRGARVGISTGVFFLSAVLLVLFIIQTYKSNLQFVKTKTKYFLED